MIKRIIFIIVISIFLLAYQKSKPMTVQERKVIDILTSKMQTRCFGRYIVDLPRELKINGGIKIDDVQITSEQQDLRSFSAMLVRREFKLRETKSWDKYPFLHKEGAGEPENTRYFMSRERRDKSPNFRKIEAYKWDNGYTIKMEIDAWDYTYPDRTNDKIVQKIGIRNDAPAKLGRILGFLKRVRGRSEDDIPTEPGVCFVGGFMKGIAEERAETENVHIAYAILRNPDVLFSIATDTDIQEDTTVLQRSRVGGDLFRRFKVKTLRSGAVDLPDLPVEEWLTSVNTIHGTPGHFLTLEANSQTGSIRSPFLMLNLMTGVSNIALETPPKSSSLSDNEVVALWDAVTRTLRPRPNGF